MKKFEVKVIERNKEQAEPMLFETLYDACRYIMTLDASKSVIGFHIDKIIKV